jgi:hypothetical protein
MVVRINANHNKMQGTTMSEFHPIIKTQGTYEQNIDNVKLFKDLQQKLPDAYLVALVNDEGQLARDNSGLVPTEAYTEYAQKTINNSCHRQSLDYYVMSGEAEGLFNRDGLPYSRHSTGVVYDDLVRKPVEEDIMDFYHRVTPSELLQRRADVLMQKSGSLVIAVKKDSTAESSLEEMRTQAPDIFSDIEHNQPSDIKLVKVDISTPEKRTELSTLLAQPAAVVNSESHRGATQKAMNVGTTRL